MCHLKRKEIIVQSTTENIDHNMYYFDRDLLNIAPPCLNFMIKMVEWIEILSNNLHHFSKLHLYFASQGTIMKKNTNGKVTLI